MAALAYGPEPKEDIFGKFVEPKTVHFRPVPSENDNSTQMSHITEVSFWSISVNRSPL